MSIPDGDGPPGGGRDEPPRHDRLQQEVPPAQVLEAAPDAMVVVDHRGNIVYVNGEAEKLFRYTRDELLGHPIEILVPDALRDGHVAHRTSYAAQPHARPMGQALNIVARRKDGTGFPADVKLSPLPTPSGLLVTAAVRDVTERRRTEERLRTYMRHLEELQASIERKNLELEQQNRELGQFAYVSSHDLQEPLRKIMAFGDRLKARCGDALDERGLDYLARMQGAAARMQTLINDLLEYSRLTTRGRAFAPVHLRAVAQATISDLEVAIEQAGGRVELGQLATIDADAVQMRQLLQNLVANAIKFRREDVPPQVKIWGEERAPGVYELHVEDNGIGLDPKYRERIFTVFERLNPRDRYEGTGIGLAICRRIAERHRGEISVVSAPGQGSDFVVRVPMKQANDREDALAKG